MNASHTASSTVEGAALFGGGADATRLQNPISSEMTHMRPRSVARPAASGRPQSGARRKWTWRCSKLALHLQAANRVSSKCEAAAILVGCQYGGASPHGSRRGGGPV